MSVQIMTQDQIVKLVAFLRVGSKASFSVNPELVDAVLWRLGNFARENNVTVELVNPTGERLAIFCGVGVFAGAAAGYVVGALPGAILGASIGLIAGYAAAHLTVCIDSSSNFNGPTTITLN